MEHTGKTLCERYRLDGLLGSGGMGTVYAGTHLRLDRPVAVKLIKPEVSRDARLVERFFREARTAASVNSVGIVDVLDLDVDPELGPFMVMEHLNGESLVKVLPRGPMAPQRAIQIITEMLDVLGAVHAKGVVHRDLKPPNVFLHRTEDGKEIVKVLDFGIAQLTFSRMTLEGAVIGTPRWMAPEQAMGRSDVDHRADLYASGLLLYSALSAQPPYHDVPAHQIGRYLERGPTPLRELVPDLPEPLLSTVDQALAPDPAKRFQSAEAMASALRACLLSPSIPPETPIAATLPTAASPVSPTAAAVSPTAAAVSNTPRRRKRALPLILFTVAVLVLAVVAGLVVLFVTRVEDSTRGHLQLGSSTCPIPTGELIGIGSTPGTIVWTGAGKVMRITVPSQLVGETSASAGGVVVEVGTYRSSPRSAGNIIVREFDSIAARAHVELANVTLFRADGQSCTLFGVARGR